MPRERIESGRDALTMSMRTASTSDDDTESVEGTKCCYGMCCGPGLALGIVACVYFIIILPSGLFLAMVGGPKNTILLLIGLAFIFGPLFIFAIACLIITQRRRARRAAYSPTRMSEPAARV